MRSFYETQARRETAAPAADRHVRRFLRLAILAFWTPCAGIDALLLWRGRSLEAVGGFVFNLLFHQALVFLALWFAVSIAHGLMTGRGAPAEDGSPSHRNRISPADGRVIAPGRYNRGQ